MRGSPLAKLLLISLPLITMLSGCLDSGIYTRYLLTTDEPSNSNSNSNSFSGKTRSIDFADLPNSWNICSIDERYTDYSHKRSYTLSEDRSYLTVSVSDYHNTDCQGSPFDEHHTIYSISLSKEVPVSNGMATKIELNAHYNERTIRDSSEQIIHSLMVAIPESSNHLLVSELHDPSQEANFQDTLFSPEETSISYELHGNTSEDLLAQAWVDDTCFETHEDPALKGAELNPISQNFNTAYGFFQNAPYSQYTISYRDNYYVRQSMSYDTSDCSGKPSYAEVTFGRYKQYPPLSMETGTITPLNIQKISTDESLFNVSMFFNKSNPLFLQMMNAYDDDKQEYTDTFFPDPSTFDYPAESFRNDHRNLYVPLTIDKLANTKWQQSHCVNRFIYSPEDANKNIFIASNLYFNSDATEIQFETRYYGHKEGLSSNLAECSTEHNAVIEYARIDKSSTELISYAGIDFIRFDVELYETDSRDPVSGLTVHPVDPPIKRYLYMAVSDGDYGVDISLVMFTKYGIEPSWQDIKTVGFFKVQ